MKFGVIEDINDPMESGRVRVRIFGLHTDDQNLIPTTSLPWAMCLSPIQSGSVSGIGISPTGIVCGAWVAVEFMDADQQYPIVIGSVHGFPVDESKKAIVEELSFTDNTVDDKHVLKDSSGTVVTTEDGSPIQTGTPEPKPEPNKPVPIIAENDNDPGRVIPLKLGDVSMKYETGSTTPKPGTINSYANAADLGGASYGTYQFASYLKGPGQPTRDTIKSAQISGSPVKQFVAGSKYASEFAGLEPATPQFDAKWKEIAKLHPTEFHDDQHKKIERDYYQLAINKLPSAITNRKKAMHEAIWSMSVQHGPGGAATIIKEALGSIDPKVCDCDVIKILYDYRIESVPKKFPSSPKLWAGITKRYTNEKEDLLKIAKTYEKDAKCDGNVKTENVQQVEYQEDQKVIVTKKRITSVSSSNAGSRGFMDPSGQFPKRSNESDVSRLARGSISGTPVEQKRRSLITKREAADSFVSEPQTQYNAKYPFNKVTETISGHAIEIDDTPDFERIHIFHCSGSFIEIHPDGSFVVKSKKTITHLAGEDSNQIIGGNQRTHIAENSDTSIMKNLTIFVHGDGKVKIDGNAEISVGGDANLTVDGNFDQLVKGNATMTVKGNYKVKAARIDLN